MLGKFEATRVAWNASHLIRRAAGWRRSQDLTVKVWDVETALRR